MVKVTLTDDEKRLLKTVYDDCMQEDQSVRERQIRQWRRLKLLWEGFQRVWFSEVAHDWRIWDPSLEEDDNDQSYYDKPINVFKAYLESIIAALSVTVPPIKCFPDDAENTLDLATAKAGDKISNLVYRHNNVALLWLHALFVHSTEGMVAFYSSTKTDKKYGTYKEQKTEDYEETMDMTVCSNCGFVIGEKEEFPGQAEEIETQEEFEFDPNDDDILLHSALNDNKDICPACAELMDPEVRPMSFVTTRIVGETVHAKSRICLEALGGLYVKIPNYCKKQSSLPYLIYSCEEDYSMVFEEFKDLHGDKKLLKKIKDGGNPGGYEYYAQWGRLNPQYQSEYPKNVVTVNRAWIRPGKFNILEKEEAEKLKKRFPDGAYVIYVDDVFAEACNENLDDHWTLTENPLSDYLHFNPPGEGLVSIQDITNDLISLILQTIEHGIGQTIADPAVFDFTAYKNTPALPGSIAPSKALGTKKLNESLFEFRTATLSSEVMPFSQQIQTFGQLTSGALPSIFGGQLEGAGGDTASGYSMSRAQALQRLQNSWKLFTITWKELFGKVVPAYIDLIHDDERDVQRDDDGNFFNVYIKKAELQGKIGKVELEANENLPLTATQRKDLLMNLLQASNPQIMSILNAPENLPLIHEALQLEEFYLPGEDDVIQQYDEIKLLLESEPIVDEMGQQQPSVPIDLTFDNHQIGFEIVRKWAVSEAGRQTKTDNPAGYENVLLHGLQHFVQLQQNIASQNAQASQGADNTPNEKPNEKDQEAPIMEESDVATV